MAAASSKDLSVGFLLVDSVTPSSSFLYDCHRAMLVCSFPTLYLHFYSKISYFLPLELPLHLEQEWWVTLGLRLYLNTADWLPGRQSKSRSWCSPGPVEQCPYQHGSDPLCPSPGGSWKKDGEFCGTQNHVTNKKNSGLFHVPRDTLETCFLKFSAKIRLEEFMGFFQA